LQISDPFTEILLGFNQFRDSASILFVYWTESEIIADFDPNPPLDNRGYVSYVSWGWILKKSDVDLDCLKFCRCQPKQQGSQEQQQQQQEHQGHEQNGYEKIQPALIKKQNASCFMTLHYGSFWEIEKVENSCESMANNIYESTFYDDFGVDYEEGEVHPAD